MLRFATILATACLGLTAAAAAHPPAPAPAAKPSFDCAKASSRLDKTICAKPELAQLDVRLADAYAQALAMAADPAALRTAQRAWLKGREPLCLKPARRVVADPAACLARLYRQRLSQLEAHPGDPVLYLSAVSEVARAFTGDVLLSPNVFVISDGKALKLQHVRSVPNRNREVFPSGDTVEVYRVVDPQPITVLNGMGLCGPIGAPEAARWVALTQAQVKADSGPPFHDVHMAVAGSAQEPDWAAPDLGRQLCDEFFYFKP